MIDKFFALGIKVSNKIGEQKCLCPKCTPTRKNKRDKSLSVNTETGLYNCHNCGWSGNAYYDKKEYTRVEKVHTNLNEKVVQYFKTRGINESTLLYFKIGESLEYMPQVNKKQRCINFNYYRDGNVVNVKYRSGDKNFKLVSGAELIFYGVDNLKLDTDTCYIVEGEIDALSFIQA